MRSALSVAVVFLAASPALAQPSLTPQEVADGWIMLFDGATAFGWKPAENVKVERGVLVVKEGKLASSVQFPVPVEIVADWKWTGTGGALFGIGGQASSVPAGADWTELHLTIVPENAGFRTSSRSRPMGGDWVGGIGSYGGLLNKNVGAEVLPGAVASFRSIKLRALEPTPLFNGKDLTGWKVFADPKRAATKFEVTKDGELSAKNGPGDLQTEKAFGNFLFQVECKTNGKWLNSGVFFRCMPEQYQNGYEAQVQNAYLGDDRTKPLDFGTGAIYRRVPARKVVSNDHEWFTLTVLADGPHIATWVNGYQTVDWTDDRKANDNPRQGLRTAPGHLSIQGHDPTTDLLFRRIRIAEVK